MMLWCPALAFARPRGERDCRISHDGAELAFGELHMISIISFMSFPTFSTAL
jgi:hypothetical protein